MRCGNLSGQKQKKKEKTTWPTGLATATVNEPDKCVHVCVWVGVVRACVCMCVFVLAACDCLEPTCTTCLI